MNIKLIIIASLITSAIFAQTTTICNYKILPISEKYKINDTDDELTKSTIKMILNAFEIAKGFDYILKFNQAESSSQIEESIVNESVKSNYLYAIAKALIGKGIYYQNRKEKLVLHQNELMGELFLIKDTLVNDWEIGKDYKKIGEFMCLKATKKCNSCNKIEEVWFAPEIPVPFGPLGYGGLPGLIVEVKNYSSILSLKEITYTKKEVKITRPIKGKKITKDELDEMTGKIRDNADKMNH